MLRPIEVETDEKTLDRIWQHTHAPKGSAVTDDWPHRIQRSIPSCSLVVGKEIRKKNILMATPLAEKPEMTVEKKEKQISK